MQNESMILTTKCQEIRSNSSQMQNELNTRAISKKSVNSE